MSMVSYGVRRHDTGRMGGRWNRRRRVGLDFAVLWRARDAAKAAELARAAERLKQERAAAVAVVRTIRRMVAAGVAVDLPAEWITAGLAEKLSEACSEIVGHAPAHARTLAEYELEVANRLDASSYPRRARAAAVACAWTDLAVAHCQGGDPGAALVAFDRADEALREGRGTAHDRAVVDVARATTLHALGRHAEALALLEAARLLFADFGDDRRAAECERLKRVLESVVDR